MGESKRFVVIEDRPEWQAEIRQALQESGHVVVDRAQTLRDALALVPTLKKLKIDAVTLDGNLCDELVDGRRLGDDGQDILRAIRKIAPKIKIIGMSLNSMPNVDINIYKPGDTKRALDTAISTLFSKKK